MNSATVLGTFSPDSSMFVMTAGHGTKPLTFAKQRSPTAGRGLMRTIFFVELFDVVISIGRSFGLAPNRLLRSSRGVSVEVNRPVALADCVCFGCCC